MSNHAFFFALAAFNSKMDKLHKLVTKEDASYFHSHKILGGLCLGNYIYRFAMFLMYGTMFYNPGIETLFWILCHTLLSTSSLIFHIPHNRIVGAPMIWPEFRLHSIVFALRSIIVMSTFWFDQTLPWIGWYYVIPFVRLGAVLGTLVAADSITNTYYESIKQQKNNARLSATMRDMPYPKETPDWLIQSSTFSYSVSQVAATTVMMFTKNIEQAFVVLFPIQLAALLMTLVRKGIITARDWHILYSVSLLMNYIYGIMSNASDGPAWLRWSIVVGFCFLRFKFRINKYILWIVVGMSYIVFYFGG